VSHIANEAFLSANNKISVEESTWDIGGENEVNILTPKNFNNYVPEQQTLLSVIQTAQSHTASTPHPESFRYFTEKPSSS
jgi:hypothetical protein